MVKEIDRQEAVRIINECDKGLIVAGDVEEVPVIGKLDETEERKCRLDVTYYEFGDPNINLELGETDE